MTVPHQLPIRAAHKYRTRGHAGLNSGVAHSLVVGIVMQRDKSMNKVVIIVLLAVAAGGTYFSLLPRFQKIAKRAPVTSSSVAETVPVNEHVVFLRINRFFETKSPKPKPFDRFKLAKFGDEYFPQDFQLQHYNNPILNTYLRIEPTLKQNDLYLYDFSDADDANSYWLSEYYYAGAPAKFRCNFIIHLEPESNAGTRIEIFEYAPRVWLGKRFSMGPHGPGMHLDIRDVESTTKDRIELMKLIKEASTIEH
jgi:hypothetical protein